MSKIAIFKGLGRSRRSIRRRSLRSFGVSPKAKPGHHWHMNKNRRKGQTTPARRMFAKAAKSFAEVLRLNPADKLSHTYIERCETLAAARPENWDGVWTMTSK